MNRELRQSSTMSLEQMSLTSTVDLLELIVRRKARIMFVLATAIALGVVYYGVATPVYQSSADVLLVQKRPEVMMRDQRYESGFEDYVSTHLSLIVSRMIVERAIESSSLGSLPTFADLDPDEDLVDVIIGQLEATSGPRNLGENADRIMTLTFQGTQPDDCPIVVNAVVDAYRAFLKEMHRDMSDDAMTLIEQARGLLQNDLHLQEDGYIDFRQHSPLVARGTDEVNPLQDRLTAIESQRSELLIRRAQIEGQLQTIQSARADQRDDRYLMGLMANLRSQTTTDNASATVPAALNSQLFQLADQEQQAIEHFGPNHPLVAAIRQRVASTRQLLALPTTALSYTDDASHRQAGPVEVNTVELYTDYLRQELDRLRVSEQLLTELYQREHDVAKELSGYQLKDESYRRNIDRTQQLYDGIISQLQEASLIKGYGGFEAHVISEPLVGERASPRGKFVLAGAVVAGSFLGLLAALLAELSDKSFHSRQEIQAKMGWTVVAQIPRFAAAAAEASRVSSHDGDAALDPLLCTYFQPRSPQAEAFRTLRTSLLFNQRLPSGGVIQVTSPSPDDGTSLITANLAVSIAQLGKRVLLIDADLHRPRQHQILGVAAERALTSQFSSGEPLIDAATCTAVENLWLLPAGPLPTEDCELFSSSQFAELLDVARQRYDFVLIDTEPLLAVSDPCVIASQVDRLLMALRPTSDSRYRANRAKEMLEALGIKPLGVVVNCVGGEAARSYRAEHDAFDYVNEFVGQGTAPQTA